MWVLAFFTHNGEPSPGLTPLVRIIDVETGLYVVFDETMVERPDGFYAYEFNTYDPSRDYAILCDSVTLSGVERYTYSSSGEYGDILDSIESTTGYIDIRTQLLRKIQTNKLVLDDGDTDNWTLYDDDSVTPLLVFDVTDKNDELIVQAPHAPSRRSMANGDVCGSGIGPSADIWMRKSVYDPDDDGRVNVAEGVSDGTYSSTASGIYLAVLNMHPPHQLGDYFVDESEIGDQLVLKYDAATNKLVYGPAGVSGTLSGTVSHRELLDLGYDDHPVYVPRDGSRGFISTVSGKDPTEDYHLTTKYYVDNVITVITGSIITVHNELTGLSADDHLQYVRADGGIGDTRGFTSTVSGKEPVEDYHLTTKWYVDNAISTATGSLTTDHNLLSNLDSDDHTQYILVDGSRGFTSTVSGIDPTDPQHLTTKQYVDTQISGINVDIQNIYNLLGEHQSGVEQLAINAIETDVSFNSNFSNINYALVLSLENQNDSPASEYAINIIEKRLDGFKVHYSGEMDSANYYLNWIATLSGSFPGAGGSTCVCSGYDCTCSGYLRAVEEDLNPALGGDLFVGAHGYELDITPSGGMSHGYVYGYSGEISTMQVDRNDNGVGTPFYMRNTGGWYQCTAASGSAQMPCAAIALEEGNGMRKIMWQGILRRGSWTWTPGDIIFVSTVEAALTNAEPTNGAWVQPVGIAIASDTIRFDPGFYKFYVGYP